MATITMRHLVLVLLLLAVKNVASVKFLPDLLQPDLEALSDYYFYYFDDTLLAYIHWPKDITFRVRPVKDKKFGKYLKIDGKFTMSKLGFSLGSFDGLYFMDSKFYFKNKSDAPLKEISNEYLIYDNQPNITPGASFLSITYFDPDVIRSTAKSMYEKNKTYYDRALPSNPATVLLTPPGSNNFLESSFLSSTTSRAVPEVDGGVRVLIGNKLKPQLRVKRARQASRILIDTNTFDVSIPEDSFHGCLFPCRSFFGVRMEKEGFLAEHRGPYVRMLSSDDVAGRNEDLQRHSTSVVSFLSKLREVEPRSMGISDGLALMPKFGKLQIRGHILEKHLNLKADKNQLDLECPFVIKFQDTVSYFLFDMIEDPVKEACFDDDRVWPKGMIDSVEENFHITLVQPFAKN